MDPLLQQVSLKIQKKNDTTKAFKTEKLKMKAMENRENICIKSN